MHRSAFLLTIVLAATATAQVSTRRASFMGGGSADRGKCTVEVVVDGAAEVSVRGDQATLRNLSGQPAEWRRFECTGPMPGNPADFRFAGVDGRGRQSLVRDPRQGGSAVVRIEDPDNGREGYTFDLFWGGYNGGYSQGGYPEGRNPNGDYRPGYQGGGGYPPPPGGGYNNGHYNEREAARAVGICQQAAEDRARRDGARRVEFNNTRMDDNPGRNDWVVGSLRAYRGPNFETYDFSCSVNLHNGEVRSVDLRRRH